MLKLITCLFLLSSYVQGQVVLGKIERFNLLNTHKIVYSCQHFSSRINRIKHWSDFLNSVIISETKNFIKGEKINLETIRKIRKNITVNTNSDLRENKINIRSIWKIDKLNLNIEDILLSQKILIKDGDISQTGNMWFFFDDTTIQIDGDNLILDTNISLYDICLRKNIQLLIANGKSTTHLEVKLDPIFKHLSKYSRVLNGRIR